jgi:hypothetical protein
MPTQRHCDRCGRKLKHERWVYSPFSRNHYCYVGEGCDGKKLKSKCIWAGHWRGLHCDAPACPVHGSQS